MTADNVHCECGLWSGERCSWSGPLAETLLVEFMPDHLRASHVAAGNPGAWPANCAKRIRVERACAERMLESDGEWCEIVEWPTAAHADRLREYTWRTDATSGRIIATSLVDAVKRLIDDDEWPTAAHVADGSWGFIEAPNGDRLTVGKIP